MGVVYAAHDPELDRKVAFKLLHPTASARDDVAARREAKAMARLRHPNVVDVYEVGTDGDQLFVAMELVDGATFARGLARDGAVARDARDVRRGRRGLAAAHAAGIVHRDFKPDNVLLDDGGRPLVTDFGLARVVAGVSPRLRVERARAR